MRLLYLTVYYDAGFDVQAHASRNPLDFVRQIQAARILFRAVIDGELVEHDTNN